MPDAPYAFLAGDRIHLKASPMLRELVRSIPGATYKAATETWSLSLGWSTALALRSTFPNLQISPELDSWGWGERFNLEERMKIRTEGSPAADFHGLYPFQNTGAWFMVYGERVLIADEMGTGKTVQAIASLRAVKSFPALVVAPNSMLWTWKAELEKWAPELKVSVVAGTAAKREKALASGFDVYVIGWANVRNHSRLAPYGSIALSDKEKTSGALNTLDFQTVIVDEAHRMVDPRAKQTRAVWAVQYGARYRWSLTGTPITNTPENVWAIMHGLAPEEYPSRRGFIDRYTISGANYFGGLEVYGINPVTGNELLSFFDSRYLRRLKAEVLPDLPPKVYSYRHVSLGPNQRRAYDQMSKHLLAAFDSGLLMADNPLTKFARLKQIAAATPELDEEGNVASLTMPSAKIDALFEIIEEAPGEPLVVFCESRKLADLAIQQLEKAGHRVTSVTGEVTGEQRTENVRAFQAGEADYIVCTLGAGGEGITLTRASTIVFLQRSDSMVLDKQAEDRLHRIGQEAASVHVIDIFAEDTTDLGTLQNVADKVEKLEEIVRDRQTLARLLKGGDD
jgi:SNF2 family DNA or RNA helicase